MKQMINKIFGYVYLIFGVIGLIIVFTMIVQLIFTIKNLNFINFMISILKIDRLELLLVDIIMFVVNIKDQPDISKGYLYVIIVNVVYLIFGGIFVFLSFSIRYGVYVLAGKTILCNSFEELYVENVNTSANMQNIDDLEKLEIDKNNDYVEQAQTDKVREEIIEWKKLFDSGKLDKESYEYEIKKLLEKEKRKLGRN